MENTRYINFRTISFEANFLVTEYHTFTTRVQKNLTNVQVLSFSEFVKKVKVIARCRLG